ncbi:MAG TPA: adenylate/guanylate cyclase domain-containing protein, partial [Burkholderiaceae bacterium]|nr:adenylate/guanylate cyclase domain-containing protein [Burkholderiaceae bacterium]
MKQSGSRHHLLAILAADVSGYTRLMANDDRATVMALDAARTVFREHVESNAGRVVDMVGDAGLAVFEAASEALHAATAIQSKLASLGHALPEERRMRLRIGIHLGEVVERSDGSVYGDGVNIAARLEALAEPGGIAVSHAVREAIGNRFDNTFDDIGARSLKNVADPVRVFVRRADNRYRFGTCELHALERRLLVDGKPVEIGVLAFDVLLVLIEQGRIVSKNELLECLGERNAAARIRTLRKLLSPETIETIPGRGYRFVARLDDARLHPPAALAILAASQPPGLKTNLPDKLPPLIGRDDDLVELRALTAKHSLVTIVGAGGVGKTRLAQALLHGQRNTYPHGVCFVELASVTDPAALPGAIAAALGVHIGTGDPLAGLVAAVAPLTVLVALDNAEHLLAEVARVADALHRGAPLATLIVTSQAPLKVSGEQLCRLSVLALPDKEITAAEA